MNKKKINNEINNLMNNLITSSYDDILEKEKNNKGEILRMEKDIKKESKFNFKKLSVAFACLVILLIGGLGYNFYSTNKAFATIDIDVNPSIEMKINKNSKVIFIEALNQDGIKILDNMDLKGSSLDVATNALIGSMLKNGYVNEIKNSLLVSVSGNEDEVNEEIRNNLSKEIDKILATYNVKGSVISQTVGEDDSVKSLAEKYDITVGKATLIEKLIKQNNLYKFEDLAKLSVNELNVLLNSNKNDVKDVVVEGTVSKKEYISETKAKQIAFNHAKVSKVSKIEIELDYEDNAMVYEIEFVAGGVEYSYEINATTGSIVDFEKEYDDVDDNDISDDRDDDDDDNDNVNKQTTTKISKTKAKQIALGHANVSNVTNYTIELDGNKYEIEFVSGNYEYSYEINASTGKVIDYDKEYDDDNVNKQTTTKISKTKAKEIALGHANVSNVTNYTIELDGNVYEIEFVSGDYEYSYEINATNGNIIDSEKDIDD